MEKDGLAALAIASAMNSTRAAKSYDNASLTEANSSDDNSADTVRSFSVLGSIVKYYQHGRVLVKTSVIPIENGIVPRIGKRKPRRKPLKAKMANSLSRLRRSAGEKAKRFPSKG